MTRKTFPFLRESRKLPLLLGLLLGLSLCAGCHFSSSRLPGPSSVAQHAAVSHCGLKEPFYGWVMQTPSLTLLYMPSSIGTWGQLTATSCSADIGISTGNYQLQGCMRLWSLQKSQNLFCKVTYLLLWSFMVLSHLLFPSDLKEEQWEEAGFSSAVNPVTKKLEGGVVLSCTAHQSWWTWRNETVT